nr:hypothetical protein [uncultured Shinella sp.]
MTHEMMPTSGIQPGVLRVASGYVVAVVLACLVVFVLISIMTGGGPGSRIFLAFFVGCAFTFGYGLPGFIAIVLISRYFNLQKQVFFIVAGGLDGALSLVIFDSSMPRAAVFLTVIAGGLAGGLVYWLIAYRLRRAAA